MLMLNEKVNPPVKSLTIPSIPPRDAKGAYEIGNGVFFEWLNDGKVAAFDIHNNARISIETYVEALLMLVKEWSPSDPFSLLILANRQGAEITRYFRDRLGEVNDAVTEKGLGGRIAIVVKRDIFVQVARGILRVQNSLTKKQIATQFFFERDEAMEWLEKGFLPPR